jgi:hypothetical protein
MNAPHPLPIIWQIQIASNRFSLFNHIYAENRNPVLFLMSSLPNILIPWASRGERETPERVGHPKPARRAQLLYNEGKVCAINDISGIGGDFALLEDQLALAVISQCSRLDLAPGQTIESEPLINVNRDNSFLCKLSP